jgi:hypothetical protein
MGRSDAVTLRGEEETARFGKRALQRHYKA